MHIKISNVRRVISDPLWTANRYYFLIVLLLINLKLCHKLKSMAWNRNTTWSSFVDKLYPHVTKIVEEMTFRKLSTAEIYFHFQVAHAWLLVNTTWKGTCKHNQGKMLFSVTLYNFLECFDLCLQDFSKRKHSENIVSYFKEMQSL